MMLESGVANLPHDMLRPRITPVGADDQQRVVVAVYSNYDFTRKELPSQETMEKLGQCLGVEGPPRWYLDGLNWYWRLW
ncbi:hypothetical protein EVJ58_g5946 [Rhodofomes roseus]|nr:hypothetical protein EVJ58_g5946 [Rhodofomes roseus]